MKMSYRVASPPAHMTCPHGPCDPILWGYLKSVIYSQKPANLEDLKQKISLACQQIPQGMIDRALVEFKIRGLKCVENGVSRIEQLT